MSGQARATLLSGINKDIQRRQLERLCRWAEEVEPLIERIHLEVRVEGRANDGRSRLLGLLAIAVLAPRWSSG